jgi:hypothetical protein
MEKHYSGNRLKSFIMSDVQTWQPDVQKAAENWRTWFISLGWELNKKNLDSKQVLKVHFKPSR